MMVTARHTKDRILSKDKRTVISVYILFLQNYPNVSLLDALMRRVTAIAYTAVPVLSKDFPIIHLKNARKKCRVSGKQLLYRNTDKQCIFFSEKKCDGVDCPPQLTAQDCREGMYFEQGPSYYDDCCPVGGSCVCNMSMCLSPLDCDSGSRLVMTREADETLGQCCDQYKCQKGM